jgi:hypothetical protein
VEKKKEDSVLEGLSSMGLAEAEQGKEVKKQSDGKSLSVLSLVFSFSDSC